MGHVLWTTGNRFICKNYWYSSACAAQAGWSGSVLIKLESMLNWVCAQVLKPNLSLRLYGRLNLKLRFDSQKQWKSPQVKSFSRRFIKLDLSNFEISCSADLSMEKSFISMGPESKLCALSTFSAILRTIPPQDSVGWLTHYHTMLNFDALKIYSCRKHSEKRRNCL